MPNKHCMFAGCRSDSRKNDPDIKFVHFPMPTRDRKRARDWLHLSRRNVKNGERRKGAFELKDISHHTFVCSRHFPPHVELDTRKNKELRPYPADIDPEKRKKIEDRLERTLTREAEIWRRNRDTGAARCDPFPLTPRDIPHLAAQAAALQSAAPSKNFAPANIKTEIKKEAAAEELVLAFPHDATNVKTYANKRRSTGNAGTLLARTPTVLLAQNIALDTNDIDCTSYHRKPKQDPEVQDDYLDTAADDTLVEAPIPDLVETLAAAASSIKKSLVSVSPQLPPESPMPEPKKRKVVTAAAAGLASLGGKVAKASKAVQCSISEKAQILALKAEIAALKSSLNNQFTAQIKSSDSRAIYYTALDKEGLDLMFKFVVNSGNVGDEVLIGNRKGRKVKDLKMPLESQFILTLVKLRRNFQFEDLAYRFGTQTRIASQIFKTWIKVMNAKFREIRHHLFIRYADLNKPFPADFASPYTSGARCVMDTIELKIESSKNQFKTNTASVKSLVALTPAGSVAFASDCFEDKTSDSDLVRHSGFLDHMEPNDVVVVGRNINGVQGMLQERGAGLMAPSSPYDNAQNRTLQNVTAQHLKKFRAKFDKFRFLSTTVPHHSVPMLSMIVQVCACMINFFPGSPVKIRAAPAPPAALGAAPH